MTRAVILLGRGYEDVEAVYPFYRLQAAGFDTTAVSESGGKVEPKLGVTMDSIPLSEVDPDAVDVLVIPGGWAPDRLRVRPAVVEFVRRVAGHGAVIASVCHGPSLLIEAELVRGRRMAAWPSIATDLRNAGATVVDEPVVVDGPFVTSRQPSDLPAFGEAIIEAVHRSEEAGGRVASTERRHAQGVS